ncbi:hypothetical protein VFPPC_13439 [Pochonia chlamydosporia 170]|uniref:Uncharacterized protein n=1 Tax=Pochonia chlamydosporia 170 TaxID=1380566 RepID=A0A179FZ09_METCM|nr:hypothetical protein VFPPC_13439 [Pochonia chlamydosporia 170]OAQ70874.1 hypothetical protein VFPPC_13439 [Pochonia chlamydosporia 170]
MRFNNALVMAAFIAVGSTCPISVHNGPPQIPPHGVPDRSHMRRPQKEPRHEANSFSETRAQPDTIQSAVPTATSEPKPEGEPEKRGKDDHEFARPDATKKPRKGERQGRSLGLPDQLPLGSASKVAAKNIVVQESTERGDNMN